MWFYFIFNFIIGGCFLYAGVKGLRDKKVRYHTQGFFGKNENIMLDGKKALAMSVLYVLTGLFFLILPFLPVIFKPDRV